MTKKNLINLIKYWAYRENSSFDFEARIIAEQFRKDGDELFANYIIELLDTPSKLIPYHKITDHVLYDKVKQYLEKWNISNENAINYTKMASDLNTSHYKAMKYAKIALEYNSR